MKSGDELKVLEAIRDRLARELEEASSREVAPLTGRLLQVMEKIKELSSGDAAPAQPAEPERTPGQVIADEVARKRARRAADQGRSAV